MVGWHHRLNGHEFEQALGGGDGQGGLGCCGPWGHRESDLIKRLNNNGNSYIQSENRARSYLVIEVSEAEKMQSQRGERGHRRSVTAQRHHHPRPGATVERKARPQVQCWGPREGSGCGEDADPAGHASRAEAGSGDGPPRRWPGWNPGGEGPESPDPHPFPPESPPSQTALQPRLLFRPSSLGGASYDHPITRPAGQRLSDLLPSLHLLEPMLTQVARVAHPCFLYLRSPHSLINPSPCTKNNLPTPGCRFSKSTFKMLC